MPMPMPYPRPCCAHAHAHVDGCEVIKPIPNEPAISPPYSTPTLDINETKLDKFYFSLQFGRPRGDSRTTQAMSAHIYTNLCLNKVIKTNKKIYRLRCPWHNAVVCCCMSYHHMQFFLLQKSVSVFKSLSLSLHPPRSHDQLVR